MLALMTTVAAGQPIRPQEPVEPFPYRVERVLIDASDEGIDDGVWSVSSGGPTHVLGATLTIPDAGEFGEGPYPGVVLMTGSGAQDRDSAVMGHKPFFVLADFLTRHGFSVLRFDDRGVGESTGIFGTTSVEGHGHDGWVAARWMMGRNEVDASRVGVMGHSQGGMLVPYVLAHDPELAFGVMLAGTGVSGAEVLADQTELMYQKSMMSPEAIRGAIDARWMLFEKICAGAEQDELVEASTDIAMIEYSMTDRDEARKIGRSQLPQFTNIPLRSFICHDPRAWLVKVDVPVLAVNGSLDTQVTPRLNLEGIRAALKESGNSQWTVIEFAGLNHLFQTAKTGTLGEYGAIQETMSPRMMGLVGSWMSGVCVTPQSTD